MLAVYILFLLFILIFTAFFISQFCNIFFRKSPVFISTKRKAINAIVENLEIDPISTVYEMGCGKASFLRKVRMKYPKANLVGIEYSFAPYLISRVINAINKSKINIVKQNFFKVSLENVDVIYCYLSCGSMKILEEKFKNECKKDALIISYQFPLPTMENIKVISIDKKSKAYFCKIQ